MTSSTYPPPSGAHPLLRAALDDWGHRAGVLSALPDAPVQAEKPSRRRRLRWPWFGRPTTSRAARSTGGTGRCHRALLD